MGTVFEDRGFKYKYEGKGSTWIKPIDNGEYVIGIGLFIDTRQKSNPEFRITLFVDSEDIRDIRAYRYSGWPPKRIMEKMEIRPKLLDKLISFGYDAWIPFPENNDIKPSVWVEYAESLLHDLYKKVPVGKRWVKKTHRWTYKENDSDTN